MTTQEAKLLKLKSLLQMVDESLTKEDFVKAFENVITFIKKIEAKTNYDFQVLQNEIVQKIESAIAELKANVDGEFSVIKAKNESVITNAEAVVSLIPAWEKQIQTMNERIAGVKDGEAGKTPIAGVDFPIPKDGSPDTAEQIRDKLETLQGENRLDASAIEGLKEFILSLVPRSSPNAIYASKQKIVLVDLSSQLDGVTKSFFLGTHFGIISVNASGAPFGAFRPTVDYNESGKNIVFTANVDAPSALAADQSLVITILR